MKGQMLTKLNILISYQAGDVLMGKSPNRPELIWLITCTCTNARREMAGGISATCPLQVTDGQWRPIQGSNETELPSNDEEFGYTHSILNETKYRFAVENLCQEWTKVKRESKE